MIKTLKNKIFKLHDSGLLVSKDGEVYVPYVQNYPAHFTYGSKDKCGYLLVGYKYKRYKVHRLVADCWIPNPDPEKLKTVDHINQVKTDNRVENLRWADMKLQIHNRKIPNNNAKSKTVYQYTLDGKLVKIWPSTQECERNGFWHTSVGRCCRGEQKQYKCYMWSYEPLI